MAAAIVSPRSLAGGSEQAPLPVVRETVRDLLLSSAAYHSLDSDKRREIARAMVTVCQTAVSLLEEEARSDGLLASTPASRGQAMALAQSAAPPVAMAQNAGQQFSGVSAQRVAGTTRAILNAVSFPRFVTELINGVFKALIDSNQQQMHSYVELIKNVAATTEGFADANLAPDRARQWLVETFPGSFTLEGGPDEDTDPRDAAEEQQDSRVRLKDGGAMPTEPALRTTLGIAPGESIPSGDPETALVPFARRALARQRQQMLATMVMLGMQRIVIESGRLNASMRFHIDTRSAANSDEGSRFDLQNKVEASARYGGGPWGVEAKMTNTIGYVSTQRNQTSEEMNTDLDLNSSVELYFKTDYVPLDRLAGAGQVDRIKVNTLNPDAEEKAAVQAREQRITSARAAESSRASDFQKNLQHQPGDAGPDLKTSAPAPAGGDKGTADKPADKSGANKPATTQSDKPAPADKGKDDKPQANPPPPADSKPADSKSVDSKPADSKPAVTPKPAASNSPKG
jgi:hypothetical protein